MVFKSSLFSHLYELLLRGTTLVTILVISADNLVFSLISDVVRPIEFSAFMSSIVLYHSSEKGPRIRVSMPLRISG